MSAKGHHGTVITTGEARDNKIMPSSNNHATSTDGAVTIYKHCASEGDSVVTILILPSWSLKK